MQSGYRKMESHGADSAELTNAYIIKEALRK
jgi:hypothetical protein